MKRSGALLTAAAALVVAIAVFAGAGGTRHTQSAQAGRLGIDDELTDMQERLISGFASFTLAKSGGDNSSSRKPDSYFPRGSNECSNNLQSNIKVNQNCLNLSDPDLQGRAQAQNETFIAVDPNDPNHIVASYNDYRRGDGSCGVSWSTDSGRTWNDSTVPNNFVRGGTRFNNRPREYYQASGDTSVGWDSRGNAYLSCQEFKRGPATSPDPDRANGLYVYRSTLNGGASWNFPGRAVFETGQQQTFLPLEDKQFMAVDAKLASPFRDRVYVTWTEFAPSGTAFIYESHSADFGETFSARQLISVTSPLCPNNQPIAGEESNCDANQFSQPFVGPDGSVYVIWNNYNNGTQNPGDNRNQILIRKSTDGGATFDTPRRVADFYDLPDCATYQGGHDFGRACVPEKGPTTNSIFRAANYASGAANPSDPAQVVVVFGSYINQHSKESNGCVPTGVNPATGQNLFTGVKTPGACNNDVVVTVSNDGGATFTGAAVDPRALPTATTEPGQATTDQWFQWIAFTKNGKLATSYYDRQYGTDEITGYSDYSLSGAGAPYTDWVVQRVTNLSMPPPTQFPEANGFGTFWGDYAGLTADTQAHPLWSDTRDPDLFACPGPAPGTFAQPPALCGAKTPPDQQGNQTVVNDQNAYTANAGVASK